VSASAQNASIVKRLREMLLRQRERFHSYLAILEQQERDIEEGDAEKLLVHVELEQAVIAEIFTLKKVIAPLEDLYQAAYPEPEPTIPPLALTLEKMGSQVIERNARNRAMLKDRMDALREEIGSLRAWPRSFSPFAEVVPSLVDITT
jgi:hypothetical protein